VYGHDVASTETRRLVNDEAELWDNWKEAGKITP
jgi:hypothetical protein